ncbi:hypothetical protein [Streptomyces sp. LaPpAH-108]|uniref:hypothetical protein n=1 Tax=Streptomyces sp. LaPpAH-108 TaxID=1155714 RepID=UPI001319F92E|nr:hypothetical protein [Streptomyces sp. LaPpAH-108]
MAAAVGLVLWAASPAAAGGPTSVLVASPESRQTTSLYNSDKEYETLLRLLGPENQGARKLPPQAGLDMTHARQINVSWMVHDMAPWRIDRVFPVDTEPGTVWIHTATDLPDSTNGYWHRAEQGVELRALLKKLGVMGARTSDGYAGVFPAPWQSESAAPSPAVAHAPKASAPDRLTDGMWWAAPGLVLGGAGGLLIRRVAARQGARPPRDEPVGL